MLDLLRLRWIAGIGNSADLLVQASAYERRGNFVKAEKFCRRALRTNIDDPAARHLLSQIVTKNGAFDEAESLLRQAIALIPTESTYHGSLGKLLSEVGRIAEAVAAWRIAVKLEPKESDANLQLGILLAQQEDRDESIQFLRQANALNPDRAEPLVHLGYALLMQNNLPEAIEQFRTALVIRPNYFDAISNIGMALELQGELAEAAQYLVRSLRINSNNPKIRAVLGAIYSRLNRIIESVVQYEEAIALMPDNAHTHFAVASVLAVDGELSIAVGHYEAAIRLSPNFAEAYCNLSLLLHELGHQGAEDIMCRAQVLAPDNRTIAINLRQQRSGVAPMWHFSMLNDDSRNSAYERAICSAVQPNDNVLDIGAGSGLLSMMAARAGASRVDGCEVIPAIAAKAREIVGLNGYSDKIAVLGKRSTELDIPLDMPEKADLLITEIFSSELLGEDVLPTLEHAKEHLLKPDARIIPGQAWIVGQLAGADALERYLRVTTVAGFDLRGFNQFSPTAVFPADWNIAMEALSNPFDIFCFDFQGCRKFPSEEQRVKISVTRTGVCYGVLQWIRLCLYDDIVYENRTEATTSNDREGHWRHMLHTFDTPVRLQQGQLVSLHASHNRKNLFFYIE